jgi:hypothetical protein
MREIKNLMKLDNDLQKKLPIANPLIISDGWDDQLYNLHRISFLFKMSSVVIDLT